jgi:hypothetical protein
MVLEATPYSCGDDSLHEFETMFEGKNMLAIWHVNTFMIMDLRDQRERVRRLGPRGLLCFAL